MEILRNFALLIQYDGTDYSGWQKQKTADTIQGEIEKAIFDLTGEKISITGSGRTDAGVHALAQVANFTLNSDFPDKDLLGGDGGEGSVGDSAGGSGQETARILCFEAENSHFVGGGGGGGSSGRIRIVTLNANSCSCTGTISPTPTHGVLQGG